MATDSAQSNVKSWELTLYEQHRQPHEPITDNTEIAVNPKELLSELTCPICLDILTNTMTTKECLHRFCNECINTALRNANKECPTCRKKLVSKRSLRPDPNTDALIAKLFPNRDEYQAHEERILEKISKQRTQSALAESIEEGLRFQAQNRQSRSRKSTSSKENSVDGNDGNNNDDDEDAHSNASLPGPSAPGRRKRSFTSDDSDADSLASASTTQGSLITNQISDDLEIILKPHPKEKHHTSVKYLKTAAVATINHLSKYLVIRLLVDGKREQIKQPPEYPFKVYVSQSTPTQSFIELDGNTPLEQVQERYWKFNKPLTLYYIDEES